jgi:hypothetical protein
MTELPSERKVTMAEPQRESERKGVASFKAGAEAVSAAEEEQQVVVTINPAMGRIVKIEKADKAGKRQEVAEEEWAKLVGEDEVEEIESALEEAFEAGVAVVLGEDYEVDEAYEDDEERSLRRVLLGGLLRRPVRRRILQRLVLSRLLRRGAPKAGSSSKQKSLATQKGA